MKRMIFAGCASLALVACGDMAETGEGADQLDTADLETATEAPAPAATPSDPAEDESDPEAAEEALDEMAQTVACGRNERTLFFCEAGRKQIAVCGVSDADGRPQAQYRYGSDTAEIVLNGGRFGNVPYSGGGEAQIEFPNGATRYIVYSRTVRTNFDERGNMPEFTDGVMVVRGGRVIADRQCTGEPQSVDVMAGEDYGGVASELFHEGN